MTLEADEFIRRFLLHVLPDGLHAHSPLWFAGQSFSEAKARPLPRTLRR